MLTLKQLTPVRMIKNKFFQQVQEAELRGASKEELEGLLGKRRSKLGMFEGNLEDGELEIGQVAAAIRDVKPAATILQEIWTEYLEIKRKICSN